MADFLNQIVKNIFAKSIAKRKLESGVELTDIEKDELLQRIYEITMTSYINAKKANSSTGAKKIRIGTMISSIGGVELAGFHDAAKLIGIGLKENKNNYGLVLQGVKKTAAHQSSKNFITLIEQSDLAEEYSEALLDLGNGFQKAQQSYKKDFKTPIEPDIQELIKEKRRLILELASQYEEPKKMK